MNAIDRSELSARLNGLARDPVELIGSDPTRGWRMLFEGEADSAVKKWRETVEALNGTGFWPVFTGDPEQFEQLAEGLEATAEMSGVSETLSMAEELSGQEWLGSQYSDPELDLPEDTSPQAWPSESTPMMQPHALFDYRGKPHREIGLAIVPADQPWQTPAALGYGGWNDCPNPEVHVAVLKYWQQIYGAVPIAITADTVDLWVERPLTSKDEAYAVAREQYRYCYDIVHQGTETVEALAAGLIGSAVWFFWWD